MTHSSPRKFNGDGLCYVGTRMPRWVWIVPVALALAIAFGQQPSPLKPEPLPQKTGPLQKALNLLREGKTAEARQELETQRKLRPDDAEILYQMARAYLIDFYRQNEPERRKASL